MARKEKRVRGRNNVSHHHSSSKAMWSAKQHSCDCFIITLFENLPSAVVTYGGDGGGGGLTRSMIVWGWCVEEMGGAEELLR